ncbi:MAG: 16S rRNA (uracil(1498)-N(3))-methyltransferase [Planctomycetes bacterium]|nr:16S rRNA (uracil(1498)-N(3))-methyltransferase [Planctomycetota bacterium]
MANRYFLPDLPGPGESWLTGDLAHHLGRVLRARPGERLMLGDGRGGTAAAVVTAVERDRLRVMIDSVVQSARPRPAVWIAFALPKAARTEWLFEHATEVGVTGFQPLWTSRTRPSGERAERWRKLVQAAAGQCDRAWLPEVKAPLELADWLAGPLPERRLLAAAGAAPPGPDLQHDTVLLVGPEGGFAAEEVAAAAAAGFVPVGLGAHILRTETAALVGAGLLLAHRAGGDAQAGQ